MDGVGEVGRRWEETAALLRSHGYSLALASDEDVLATLAPLGGSSGVDEAGTGSGAPA